MVAKRLLIRSTDPVLVVGAGPLEPEQLETARRLATQIVAVDGGVHHVTRHQRDVLAVIGDMDSIEPGWRPRGGRIDLFRIDDQDSTDLEKCLRSVEAPLLLGLGFLGGRVDHHLAAMNALARNPRKRLLLLGRQDICFHCPGLLELDLEAGTRVSLFPMRRVEGLRSEGLRWPVTGLRFRPSRRIGTSNEATGGPVRLSFDRSGMLVILPAECLDQVASRLGPETGREA